MTAAIEALEARGRDTHASDSSLRYMPGLDVARGLAILLVLFYHGLAFSIPLQQLSERSAHIFSLLAGLGQHGVHLFFVLSGFLITGILLDSRRKAGYYRTFYLRRALRILPASILILIVLRASHFISWAFFAAAMLYCANMASLFGATMEYGVMWSLSVEEQFYFVWPLVVRKMSSVALAWLCVGIVALTPVLRLGLQFGPTSLSDIHFKTWVVCDFFAAGALIALAARSAIWSARMPRALPWLLVSGLVLVVALAFTPNSSRSLLHKIGLALYLEPWLLLCTGIVLFCFLRPSLAAHAWASPFLFLAKISYGLYLVHEIVFYLVDRYWGASVDFTWHSWGQLLLRFFVSVGLSIAIASVSRFTLEEFFLRLKPRSPSSAPLAAIH